MRGRAIRAIPTAIVDAFLQHKSMEQMQDYVARGRRFAKLDVERLNRRLDHCR